MQRNDTLGPTKRHPELLMLSSTTRPTGAKALSTGGGRRCCSFRAVAEIGKPNTQGVAARCPGQCAHCPFRTLTIPPPCRDVACYVSNIPADDPNGDIARISNIPKLRHCTHLEHTQTETLHASRTYPNGDVARNVSTDKGMYRKSESKK